MDVPEGKKNIGGDDSKGQLNANQNFSRFLPYQTNKDRSIFFCDFLVSVGNFFCYDPCLVGQKSGNFLVGILGETMTS